MKFSKNTKQTDSMAGFSEQEFDQFLREVDDLAGDAPGLRVSPDFLHRVVELAGMETKQVAATWYVRRWFSEFSLTMKLAVASAVLLACLGGIRAGQTVTEIIAGQAKHQTVEFVDPLGLAAPEQAIVQLMQNDGLTIHSQSRKTAGEQQ